MAATHLTLNQTTLLGATTGTIQCMFMPVYNGMLLLPKLSVVEVLDADKLLVSSQKESWQAGSVIWSEQKIPVIWFEALNAKPAPTKLQKIAIVCRIAPNASQSFYGIALQSAPRVDKVKIAQLEDLENAPLGPVEFLHVRCDGQLMAIPDLDKVEACIQ
jgi:hypothetical protein